MTAKLAAEIEAILSEGRDMTVATIGAADGSPHATMVSYASAGQRIYFGCSPASQKARNLELDPRIAITITLPYRDWAEIRGLSAQGQARRVPLGSEADEVALLFARKFSEIAQYVGGVVGDIALFEVTLSTVAVLDYRQGFGHVTHVGPGMAVTGFAAPGSIAGPPREARDV